MLEIQPDFKEIWSGSEPYQEFTELIIKQSSSSPSEAWISSIRAYSFRFGLYFNEMEDFQGIPGTSRFSSGLVASGKSKSQADDQISLAGEWRNISGIHEADHAVVRAIDENDNHWYFLLHRNDWSIQPEWDMVALQETFSDTLVVEEALLRETRRVSAEDILSGRPVEGFEKITSIPLQAVGTLTTLAPLVGISEETYDTITNDRNPKASAFLETLETAQEKCLITAEELDNWSTCKDAASIHQVLSQAGRDLHKVASEYLCSSRTSFWSRKSKPGNRLRDIIVGSTHPAISRV